MRQLAVANRRYGSQPAMTRSNHDVRYSPKSGQRPHGITRPNHSPSQPNIWFFDLPAPNPEFRSLRHQAVAASPA
jgi:hypothetical protein